MVLHGLSGGESLWTGLDWTLVKWVYPIDVVRLPAPFAFTASFFCLGKKKPKPPAPAYGPTLRFGSPRFGVFQGHAALRLASPSLRLALFGYAEGAAHRPLQTPTLGLLKSQSYGRRLEGLYLRKWIVKIVSRWERRCGDPTCPAIAIILSHRIAGQARSHRNTIFVCGKYPLHNPLSKIKPSQAPPVTLRLQEAEWRCL
jgi:hypothetical protein